jgi:hypothetical protein
MILLVHVLLCVLTLTVLWQDGVKFRLVEANHLSMSGDCSQPQSYTYINVMIIAILIIHRGHLIYYLDYTCS